MFIHMLSLLDLVTLSCSIPPFRYGRLTFRFYIQIAHRTKSYKKIKVAFFLSEKQNKTKPLGSFLIRVWSKCCFQQMEICRRGKLSFFFISAGDINETNHLIASSYTIWRQLFPSNRSFSLSSSTLSSIDSFFLKSSFEKFSELNENTTKVLPELRKIKEFLHF